MIRCLILFAGLLLLTSCEEESYPRPRGYHRLELPAHSYHTFDTTGAPFTLELPDYARVKVKNSDSAYYDIHFPEFNCYWHMTTRWFKNEGTDPFYAYEDYRSLVYKHAQKGVIKEMGVKTDDGIGTMYLLSGNVPSPIYVFFSDTTNYALECSFYFNTAAKNDSLAPIIEHLETDMLHMVRSVKFRNQ